MKYAYQVAAKEAAKNATQNKERYDRKICETKVEVGDRVLVRKVGIQGKCKLADKWEMEPYLIINIPNSDIPVYRVKRVSGEGPLRTLHRNMLLPFNTIPNTDCTVQDPIAVTKPKQIHLERKKVPAVASGLSKNDSSSLSTSFYPNVEIIRPKVDKRTVGITLSDSVNSAHITHIESTSAISQNRPLTSTGSTLFWDNISQSENNTSSFESNQSSHHTYRSSNSDDISLLGNPSVNMDESINNTINMSLMSNASSPVPEVRRTTRQRKAPDRLGQWVMSQIQSKIIPNEIFV